MDNCCLNRAADDQTQPRIRIESEAIQEILLRCEQGLWKLVGSSVLLTEINNNTHEKNKKKVLALLNTLSSETLKLTDDVISRAEEIRRYGIKNYDSFHLSVAECAEVDVFLTVDDRFLRAAKRFETKIRVMNPTELLMEVFSNE